MQSSSSSVMRTSSPRCRGVHRLLSRELSRVPLVVAVLLLALRLAATPASAQIPVILQVSGYVHMSDDDIANGTAQLSATTAQQWCNDNGASLIADSRAEITQTLQRLCMSEGRPLCTSFMDGSAKPRAGSTNGCVDGVPNSAVSPNSLRCTYRWRFGFYDNFAETYGDNGMIQSANEYEPGLCFFKGLYTDLSGLTGVSQFCNGFVLERIWNSSNALYMLGYPHGYYQVIAGVTSSRYFRMDTDELAVDNDPNPLSSYTVFCYLQDYPLPALWSEKPKQPAIIKDYKDLTWAQKYWWVIFFIITFTFLSLLFAIILYCTITSKPAKMEPFLPMMVQREREGIRYLYGPEKDMANDGGTTYSAMTPPPTMAPNILMPGSFYPGESAQRAMRMGKGFTANDPENALRGNAAIYGADDVSQHGDMDAQAAQDELDAIGARILNEPARTSRPESGQEPENPFQETSQFVPGDGLGEEMLSVAGPEDANDSHVPSVKSRRSVRRSRGRTTSQTFSEVELPVGSEINEQNIEL